MQYVSKLFHPVWDEDKNTSTFLNLEPLGACLPGPRELSEVTFAGCDVENWIQVWLGVQGKWKEGSKGSQSWYCRYETQRK